MNQDRFEAEHGADWERFEAWLEGRRDDPRRVLPPAAEIPRLYRRLCHHLALARERHYGSALVERLHHLALGGHQRLYGARPGTLRHLGRFLALEFPAQVRARAALVWLACALFYGPALVMAAAVSVAPEMVYAVLEPGTVSGIEQMYEPGRHKLGREREADGDLLMFGFYIRNNIGIAFQTFAGGLLFTLGSLFYLGFNGLFMGAVAAHLTRIGSGEPFWSFVVGHSALELTAIVLAGAAGINLGLALLRPGRHRRSAALRIAAGESARIVSGAALMLLLAAFVEAFWSSTTWVAPIGKYAVGLGLWAAVIGYLTLQGRDRAT